MVYGKALRFCFLASILLQSFAFNIEPNIDVTISSSESTNKYSNLFGYSFAIKLHDDIMQITVGAPKMKYSEKSGHTGQILYCSHSVTKQLGSSIKCSSENQAENANTTKPLNSFGQYLSNLPTNNMMSCIPNQEVNCGSIFITPGFCMTNNGFNTSWHHIYDSKACPDVNLDLLFVLDGSGSVGFYKFNIVKNWTQDLAENFLSKSRLNTQMGVIEFSTNAKINVELKKYNILDFKRKVKAINLSNSGTNTKEAFELAQHMFSTSYRANQDKNTQVLILVTDGRSNNPKRAFQAAEDLRNQGVKIFAIGVADIDIESLKKYATGGSSDERVFKVNSYAALDEIVTSLETNVITLTTEGQDGDSSELVSAQAGFSAASTKLEDL